MDKYKQRVTTANNVDSNDNLNLSDNSDTVSKKFLFSKSRDISSFFDSTEEVHRKYSESDIDINSTTQGLFFLMFEKLEDADKKIK